jgi:chemosensory pili system protein ChpC
MRSAVARHPPMAERVNEIYSLLIPLVDARLLVPRACIAEVVGFQTPSEMTGAPPWYIGTIPWSGRQVPLVSFEGACGQNIPPAGGRTRVVIFHCIDDKLDGGCFGVVSQGFPQLVRVSSDVVRPDNSRVFPERMPVICQVRMLNEAPLVPDIQRLEEMIAEETNAA